MEDSRLPGYLRFPDDVVPRVFALRPETYKALDLIEMFMWRFGEGQCSISNDPLTLAQASGLSGAALKRAMANILNPAMPLLAVEANLLVSPTLRQKVQKQRDLSSKRRENALQRVSKPPAKTEQTASKIRANSERGLSKHPAKTEQKHSIFNPNLESKAEDLPAAGNLDSSKKPEPESVGSILGRVIPNLPDTPSLLEIIVGYEPEADRARMLPVWARRIAVGAPVSDWVDEIKSRNESRVGVGASKGFNGLVDMPAAWMQDKWNRWSEKNRVSI